LEIWNRPLCVRLSKRTRELSGSVYASWWIFNYFFFSSDRLGNTLNNAAWLVLYKLRIEIALLSAVRAVHVYTVYIVTVRCAVQLTARNCRRHPFSTDAFISLLCPQVKLDKTANNKPSRVIHIRNIPNEVTEAEVIHLGIPFGKVTNVLVLKGKNQVSDNNDV